MLPTMDRGTGDVDFPADCRLASKKPVDLLPLCHGTSIVYVGVDVHRDSILACRRWRWDRISECHNDMRGCASTFRRSETPAGRRVSRIQRKSGAVGTGKAERGVHLSGRRLTGDGSKGGYGTRLGWSIAISQMIESPTTLAATIRTGV